MEQKKGRSARSEKSKICFALYCTCIRVSCNCCLRLLRHLPLPCSSPSLLPSSLPLHHLVPVKNGSSELIRVGSGEPFRNDSVAPLTVFRFRSSGTSRENAPFPERFWNAFLKESALFSELLLILFNIKSVTNCKYYCSLSHPPPFIPPHSSINRVPAYRAWVLG